MELKDTRNKNKNELINALKKAKEDYRKLANDILQKKEKNVTKPKFLRKDIARIKTILKEKELVEENKHE